MEVYTIEHTMLPEKINNAIINDELECFTKMSNAAFAHYSRNYGQQLTLQEFQDAFNNDEISPEKLITIRFIESEV